MANKTTAEGIEEPVWDLPVRTSLSLQGQLTDSHVSAEPQVGYQGNRFTSPKLTATTYL